MADTCPPESAEKPRRSSRARSSNPAETPVAAGHRALLAAHEYLDGKHDSPGVATDAHCVDRQHINYYVRKHVAAGVQRSEKSVPTVSDETTKSGSEQYPTAYERWCLAWAFAHERAKKISVRAAIAMGVDRQLVNYYVTFCLRA